MNNILELRNLTKTYASGDDTLLILDDVDFSMEKGRIISLSGESGSGKSTFLNLVGALDRADAGSLTSCGVDLTAADEKSLSAYRNRKAGFIFQFHYLLKDFTALENVMMPGRISGKSRKELTGEAEELLRAVGLEKRSHHFPGQLSGGERQRVALARALINKPELLLADEPTGSLDSANSRLVEELLFSLCEDKGLSLILVTHDPGLASRTPVRYKLDAGKMLLV